MRRPLPNSKALTQTECVQGEPDCPTPTPPACPVGHVCTPPTTTVPNGSDPAHGWFVHCGPPKLADCEEIRSGPSGPEYTTVDDSACSAPQSSELNAITTAAGDRIPGVFYDFTAICGGGGTPTPPPTLEDPDIPGLSIDPDDVEGGPGDPPFVVGHVWEVGPWQGTSQCGQVSTLTRSLKCVALSSNGLGGEGTIGRLDKPLAPGESPVLQASFSGDGPGAAFGSLAPATFDPASDDVKAFLAQFDPNDTTLKRTTVSPELCFQDAGFPPMTSYTGDKAGCTYTKEESFGEWTNPHGGSATCSSDAQRQRNIRCLAANGDEVASKYCTLALTSGGQEDTRARDPQRGNFSGCTAQWEDNGYDLGCHPSGQPTGTRDGDGAVHYRYVEFQCVRSDGVVLTGVDEAACPADDRGFDGYKAIGSCEPTFYTYGGNTCMGTKVVKQEIPQSDIYSIMYEGGGAQTCLAAGVSCCQVQRADYSSGTKYQLVGTMSQPVSQYGFYYDYDGTTTCYGSRVFLAGEDEAREDWCGYDGPNGTRTYGPCNPSTAYTCGTGGATRYGLGGSGVRYRVPQ